MTKITTIVRFLTEGRVKCCNANPLLLFALQHINGCKKIENAEPSSRDLDPEIVMVAGGGKKCGRPTFGACALPVQTENLASIRARSMSLSLQIQTRDEPARDLRAVSFATLSAPYLL
jgi:hypothetical protein